MTKQLTHTFPFHSDPGHGWTKVPKAYLRRVLGEGWRKHFSHCSYERGDYVYLEEDADTCKLVELLKERGIEARFRLASNCANRLSRIRNYLPLAIPS